MPEFHQGEYETENLPVLRPKRPVHLTSEALLSYAHDPESSAIEDLAPGEKHILLEGPASPFDHRDLDALLEKEESLNPFKVRQWAKNLTGGMRSFYFPELKEGDEVILDFSESHVLYHLLSLLAKTTEKDFLWRVKEERYFLKDYRQNPALDDEEKESEETKKLLLLWMASYFEECPRSRAPKKEEILFFRKELTRLAEKDLELEALLAREYYQGSYFFARDDEKAKKLLLDHFDKTRDPEDQNLLGYLEFYGRNEYREPHPKEAFQHFLYGAAFGNEESRMKLSDCYRDGFGTAKDERLAYELLLSEKESLFLRFLAGDLRTPLADYLLRLGRMEKLGIGTSENPGKAMHDLLLSGYVLKKRRALLSHVGDESVARRIDAETMGLEPKEERGLDETLVQKEDSFFEDLGALGSFLVEEKSLSQLLLRWTSASRKDVPLVLSSRAYVLEAREVLLSVELDPLSGSTVPFRITPSFFASPFVRSVRLLSPAVKNSSWVTFLAVRFEPGGKNYYYRYEGGNVPEKVYVPLRGEEKEVAVQASYHRKENSLVLPKEAYRVAFASPSEGRNKD